MCVGSRYSRILGRYVILAFASGIYSEFRMCRLEVAHTQIKIPSPVVYFFQM